VLFAKGLAVSIPLRELRDIVPAKSIFDASWLAHAGIAADLAIAIDLVLRFCALLGRRVVFIYRPEIFTHGDTLSWLHQELGGIEDHLSISDGSAIKLVRDLHNHMFLYAPGKERHLNDFRRLVERAPEIMPQLGFQINTAYSLRNGAQTCRPRSLLLQAHDETTVAETDLCKFYLNPNGLDSASVGRSLKSPSLAPGRIEPFRSMTYVPFNGSAAADRPFCRMVARMIIRSVGDRQGSLLVLGCHNASHENDPFADRVTRLLVGIQASGIILPRAILGHVLVSAGFVDLSVLEGMANARALMLHDTFEFWLLCPAYYAVFDRVTLVLPQSRRRDRAAMTDLLADAAGRVPEIAYTAAEPRASLDIRLAHA
jgi:hypothetical protein